MVAWSIGIQAQAQFATNPVPRQSLFTPALEGADSSVPTKKQAHKQASKEAEPPSITIPLGPLGFAAPAPFYFGERFAMVSLNFLDENSLLFTFRVPGLIAREAAAPGQPSLAERHIRALTLDLPSGKVTAESLWVLHDYERYLWGMQDKKFLLRDRNLLQVGDAELHLEPFLRFPGQVNSVQFDPSKRLLVTDTTEAPAIDAAPEAGARNPPLTSSASPVAKQTVSAPAGAAASMVAQGVPDSDSRAATQRLVRILSLDTRKVMLFSRVNGTVHLPVDGEGYYETLRGNEDRWLIAYERFRGGSTPIGSVSSACDPALEALAAGIVVASACVETGARRLTAFARDQDKDHARLWELALPATKVWPQWATSGDGMRFARATLEVSHPLGLYSPLNDSDVRGQNVQVFDLATGAAIFTAPLSPVLDGGGNFALSPSGRRLALLNQGSIQVFDLPPEPAFELRNGSGADQKP